MVGRRRKWRSARALGTGTGRSGTGGCVSGEAGIGKSRLVMALKEYVAGEPHTRWECRCSPYFQDSALYPLIDRSQRALRLAGTSRARQSSRSSRWRWRAMASPSPTPWGSGLRSIYTAGRFVSAPEPDAAAAETADPRSHCGVAAGAGGRATGAIHYRRCALDRSFHAGVPHLLIDQVPTARLLTLLTCRPEFSAPWGFRAHLTPLTLTRSLGPKWPR